MAKTNWQDPKSSEIRSTHISGLQEAVGKLEESIGLETVAGTDIPLTEVFISNDDRCRIYQAPEGKRNWLLSPAPVIKKNGVVITDDFEIDYGGGAVIFTTPILESDILTADATYTKKIDDKQLEILSNKIDNLAGEGRTTQTVKGNADKIGDLSTLKTDAKSDLVNAVNEVKDDLVAHKADIAAHKRTLTYLTYYVNADTGNDNNQGTVGAPFKTIKKAIDSIPVGTAGLVRLLGGTAFSIDTPIYVYNKVVVLEGGSDDTLVNITSTIYLIDSTFSVSRVNMYAETSGDSSAIFYCSGIVGIKCGGYSYFNVRPLQETSNVNFIYVSAVASGNEFFTRPVAIYLIGDRLNFRTDNYPSYSGTFNVFAKSPYYTFPVVFTRWWQMTKDANVNWGATEYQLGSSGTSLWYF